jgi:hypothetical protein
MDPYRTFRAGCHCFRAVSPGNTNRPCATAVEQRFFSRKRITQPRCSVACPGEVWARPKLNTQMVAQPAVFRHPATASMTGPSGVHRLEGGATHVTGRRLEASAGGATRVSGQETGPTEDVRREARRERRRPGAAARVLQGQHARATLGHATRRRDGPQVPPGTGCVSPTLERVGHPAGRCGGSAEPRPPGDGR